MNWLLLALLAAFLWGLTNVIDAAVRRCYVKNDHAMMWWVAARQIPLVILLLPVAGFQFPDSFTFFGMMIAGLLWVLPFQFYFRAMHIEDPSRVTLFLQLVPLFTLLIAWLLIGETLNMHQGIGFTLLLLGGILAAVRKMKGRWHFSIAFVWMLFAGILWAISDVLFKYFEASFPSFLSAVMINFAGMALFSLWQIRSAKSRKKILVHFKDLPSRAWWMLILMQVLGLAGSIAFAYALVIGKVSLVTVMLGTQPLFTFMFSLLLAPYIHEVVKEEIGRRSLLAKSIAFMFVFFGLYLLNF